MNALEKTEILERATTNLSELLQQRLPPNIDLKILETQELILELRQD